MKPYDTYVRGLQKIAAQYPGMRHYGPAHDFSREPWGEEGVFVTKNVAYESRYDNNLCDVYTDGTGRKMPVFLYAHGGGFVFGDKDQDDLSVPGTAGIRRMIGSLVRAGVAVVCVNYALAPDARYPVPVRQANELCAHLCKNADALCLDMTRVAVGGGSAGGHLFAQFALACTDPSYARVLGIVPALGKDVLKAVYLGCALLDPRRFAATGDAAFDECLAQMACSYFDTDAPRESDSVREADIIEHVTSAFPPAFVCDGNTGTFNDQAHDFSARLTALGVEHEARIFDAPEENPLPHGFDTLEDERGKRCREKAVAFLVSRLV